MDSELQKTSEDVIKAVQLIMNPMTPQNDRRIAHEFLENFKDSSPLCAKCGFFLIIKSNPALIRHCGFQLIENYIKLHWIKINDEEKAWIKNTAMQILASGTGPVLEEEVYVKDGMSKIIVELIKREWPQQWTSLLDELHHICKMGDAQTELVLLIFSRLVEDIVQFQNIPEKRRREIYTYLSSFVFRFFEFFSATLFENYEKYIDKKQLDSSIADKETLICCKLIQVTLDTISIFVEWVSIECIKGNRILFSLLCKMLSVPDFRLKAVICMLNVVERKTPPEERKELLFFFEESIIFELINNLDVYNQDNYLFFKTLLQCFLALGTNLSSCMTQFDIEAPTNFSLYLNCVISFTRHPSVVLSQIAQNIWMNILRSPILSVDPLVQSFVPVIFKHGIEKLIKCGYPSQNDCLSCKFSQIEFDSDEDFEKALYRCRSDVIENFKLICKIQPKAAFQFGSLLLKSLINGQDWKTYLDNPIAVMSLLKCWEAIVLYMEPICCVLLKNIDNPEVKDLLNEGLELLDLILNFTYDDAVILSLSLSCISALFFFITFQPELRVTILEKIFFYLTCFAHKTPNDREILNLRRHASSLLIKLSTNFPKILLPEFDNLCSKVQTLFQNKEQVTRFEKCALLEALMILSNNFCDYDRQSNFLKAALSFIDSVWICPPIIQGIESCDAFISFIGIDKHPPSPNENTINPFASDLIMGINVIKACVKRCVCPSDPQSAQRGNFVHPLSDSFGCVFYRNPAAQYVIPVLDKIFQIVRILNELYDPLQQQKFDSSYCKLLDITDADKSMILGIPVVENPQQLKTASDHARFYLHNLHDACLHILCNAVENLGIDFYIIHNLPNLLKGNILHKIEYMPAMKLRNLVHILLY
ncbi:exportin-5 [Caerostris darwini]|uniref:Exportin-5 n=1 Tax=Caerostris darwini TaxID=1538125 RepID=A0AAV4RNW5_9ARAC|nr:exportin-5 [Caerostris darwini]